MNRRIHRGLVAWADDSPCPCNIAVFVDGDLRPLAKGHVVFTVEDAELIEAAIREELAELRAAAEAVVRQYSAGTTDEEHERFVNSPNRHNGSSYAKLCDLMDVLAKLD